MRTDTKDKVKNKCITVGDNEVGKSHCRPGLVHDPGGREYKMWLRKQETHHCMEGLNCSVLGCECFLGCWEDRHIFEGTKDENNLGMLEVWRKCYPNAFDRAPDRGKSVERRLYIWKDVGCLSIPGQHLQWTWSLSEVGMPTRSHTQQKPHPGIGCLVGHQGGLSPSFPVGLDLGKVE